MKKLPIMTYDSEAHAFYLRLRTTKIKHTTNSIEQLSRTDIDIHLDLDSRNRIVGVEILL